MMKRNLPAMAAAAVAFVLAFALPPVAAAQTVKFDLRPTHSTYVVGEPIEFALYLENAGTTPVVVDTTGPYAGNRLFLEVTTQNGNRIQPLENAELADSIMLAPGEVFSADFDMGGIFPILRQGSYRLRAKLLLDGRLYETNLRAIDIVPGLELASAVQAVPDNPGHRRELRLVYLARERQEFVFLRCLDDGAQESPTLRLGPIVRIARPTITFSPDGAVVVRHQATRNKFQETRIRSDADGLRVMGEKQNIDRKSSLLLDAILPPEESSEPAAPPPPSPRAPRHNRREAPADGW